MEITLKNGITMRVASHVATGLINAGQALTDTEPSDNTNVVEAKTSVKKTPSRKNTTKK